MLWNKLNKSLIAITLAMQTAAAVAQSYNIPRTQTNEPLPTLIIPQDSMVQRNGTQKNNRIQINSVQWSVSGKYDRVYVHSDLSYDFIRTYNFRIIPSMKVNGRSESLPDGVYYIRAVVLKPNLSEQVENFDQMTNQFVVSSQRPVSVVDGIIAEYLTFSFPSPTVLTFKNRLFIEIIPLQQNTIAKMKDKGSEVVDPKNSKFIVDTALPTVVLSIPFVPNERGDSISTINKTLAADITYDESIDLGAVIAEGNRKLNKALSAKKNDTSKEWARKNRTAIATDDSVFEKYQSIKSREEACKIISNSISYRIPQLKRSAVEKNARSNLNYFCNEHENSMVFQKIQFVNENSQMTLVRNMTVPRQLGVSLTKGNNTSYAYDQSSSYSAGVSLSPLDIIGKIPGMSISANRNFSITESLSHSQFATGVMMENLFLEINHTSVDVKASKVQTCYLLKINKSHSYFSDDIKGQYLVHSFGKNRTWGHLVCQSKEEPAILHENYFHIFPALKGQGIADSTDPRNQVINLSIRGLKEWDLFKYQVRKFISKKYQDQILPHDAITSTVAAETTAGVNFTSVDLGRPRPGFIERNFYKEKEVEQP